ncbi:hypothetical protein M9H77_21765 [Catharanthus roseus]|uniref:Uncharacterized protein n=1 Tax=Catharanthus roseus TaxID=4058 RepID=A0ACC0AN80_CATRO|nr:hypothetical protein M9H77_21765 [Catharanthus roseus]
MGPIDMGFSGYPYTWNNKRAGRANIQTLLDNGLINADWRNVFPKARITHFTSLASDHTPLLFQTNPLDPSRLRPFHFEAMWARDSESFDIHSIGRAHQGYCFFHEKWQESEAGWLAIGKSPTQAWSQVIRAKYLKGRSLLDVESSPYAPSWTWAGTWETKELVSKGAIYQLSACWKPPPQGWYISLIQHLIKMVTLLVRCLSEIQKEILREHRQKRIVSWMSSTKATIAKFALAIAEDLAYNKINCKKGMPLW